VACSTIKFTLQCAERGGEPVSSNGFGVTGRYGYSDFLLRVHDRSESLLQYPRDDDQLDAFQDISRYVFGFVRNPFSRVLSAYIDKIERNAERRALFLANLGKPTSKSNENVCFVEFLELVRQQTPETMDPHWRPQYAHLSGRLNFNFLGVFERFEDDFRTVLTSIDPMLQCATKVQEHGTNASSLSLLERYYADSMAVRLVSEIYQQDFNLFDYPNEVKLAAEPPRSGEARLRDRFAASLPAIPTR
jgi:hypothetical protein